MQSVFGSPERLSEFRGRSYQLIVKRLVDVCVAALVLLAGSPLFSICALLVRLSGPGPVLYRGIRTGRFGKPFRILKFRTMVVDAERLGGPTTGTNDLRVTRIGRVLRRTKLDEIPQFVNVLVGDMSLVGPRPEVPVYTDTYSGEEQCILLMRPGLTDYASIEFADLDDLVGDADPDEYFRAHIMPRKTALRVKYVNEWSLKNDLWILSQTAWRVMKRIIDH